MTAAETTHRAEQELGPAIVDGVVRWVSATLVTGADHESEGGCLRRTWFERVGGRDRDVTPQMTAGVEMHAEIEAYLRTGRDMLGRVARAGKHLIDQPGPGLIVEQPIIQGGDGKITGVWLRCAGVPYAGHVDLFNHRGEHLDPDGELRRDPPGTVEVKDWKSTSDLRWAKTPEQVASTIQMTGYGMAAFAMWPHLEHARLTHVYFQRNGTPRARLATLRPPREKIERRWEYAGSVVRRIVDAARETDWRRVDYNTRACRAYQRDCPHLAHCPEGRASREFDSLDQLLGPRMAEQLTARMRGDDVLDGGAPIDALFAKPIPFAEDDSVFCSTTPPNTDAEETDTMGLFEIIKPAAQPSPLDALMAEEAQQRAALDPPPPAPVPATREFAEALGVINASPLGFPKLTGQAALMFGTLNKHELRHGMVIPARGVLEKLPEVSLPEDVVRLAGEIAAKYPQAQQAAPIQVGPAPAVQVQQVAIAPRTDQQAVAILPPDAPASDPRLAADPVEGLATPKALELAALTSTTIPGLAESVAVAGAVPPLPPTVQATPPAAIPALASNLLPTAAATPVAAEAPAPAKKSSKKKPTAAKAPDGAEVESTDGAINIYADCVVDGAQTQSLREYVDRICSTLCAEFGAADVRCAPADSALGFNKWRGAVAALAAKSPPPPGSYHVDTRGDEVAEIVVVALRAPALASGGVHVRGVR